METPQVIVLILDGRGQLIYQDPSRTPLAMPSFEKVNYASCVKYGVCAYPQYDWFEHDLKDSYVEGLDMSALLPFLGVHYETTYAEFIASKGGEFKYQSSGYWTKKNMKYDKYIRCYPVHGMASDSPFKITSFGVRDGNIMEVSVPTYEGEKILLSTLIATVRRAYPNIPIDIYDKGCLKLLSDEDIDGEPNQLSRVPSLHGDQGAFILSEVSRLNTNGGKRRTKRRIRRSRR